MAREIITNDIFLNLPPGTYSVENPATVLPGRRDIRISLTPRCNLVCQYCHNEGQFPSWISEKESKYLEASVDSIGQLIAIADNFGVKSVKFTGGEPGVYNRLAELLAETGSEWQEKYRDVVWGMNTNGVPFLAPTKLAMLVESPLQYLVIGLDSMIPGENSKPDSKIGITGTKLFESLVIPVVQQWGGKPEKRIAINVVYTGNEERVLSVLGAVQNLGSHVSAHVIEINGVMGMRQQTRQGFLDLLNRIADIFELEPKYDEELNEVNLYEAGRSEAAIKFYQDHCVDFDCGHCRKLHMRVVPTLEGLATVPCFLQSQGSSFSLTTNGLIDADKFTQIIPLLGTGPDWRKKITSI